MTLDAVVAAHPDALTAKAGHFGGGALHGAGQLPPAVFGGSARHIDRRTRLAPTEGDPSAEPPGRTGDDGNLPIEARHLRCNLPLAYEWLLDHVWCAAVAAPDRHRSPVTLTPKNGRPGF